MYNIYYNYFNKIIHFLFGLFVWFWKINVELSYQHFQIGIFVCLPIVYLGRLNYDNRFGGFVFISNRTLIKIWNRLQYIICYLLKYCNYQYYVGELLYVFSASFKCYCIFVVNFNVSMNTCVTNFSLRNYSAGLIVYWSKCLQTTLIWRKWSKRHWNLLVYYQKWE